MKKQIEELKLRNAELQLRIYKKEKEFAEAVEKLKEELWDLLKLDHLRTINRKQQDKVINKIMGSFNHSPQSRVETPHTKQNEDTHAQGKVLGHSGARSLPPLTKEGCGEGDCGNCNPFTGDVVLCPKCEVRG